MFVFIRLLTLDESPIFFIVSILILGPLFSLTAQLNVERSWFTSSRTLRSHLP
jgi:hypothetical protein